VPNDLFGLVHHFVWKIICRVYLLLFAWWVTVAAFWDAFGRPKQRFNGSH
jgi:hypothetical protein